MRILGAPDPEGQRCTGSAFGDAAGGGVKDGRDGSSTGGTGARLVALGAAQALPCPVDT